MSNNKNVLKPEVQPIEATKEDKLYLVLQTEVYFDEIRHEIIAFWDNKKDALLDAEKQIKAFTKDNYRQAGDSFYGDADDVICIISVVDKRIVKEENITQVL